jgi:hypothetical protein
MSSGFLSIEALERQVKALADAAGPSEVFRCLLEGARLAAPRAAMFLVRKGQIKGWGCVGYTPEATQRQRAFVSAANSGWLGRIASSREIEMERREGSGLDPEFGQPPVADAVTLAVRIKERTIALLLAERSAEEQPWFPSVLGLLVGVARLRLDLDLARRKLESKSAGAPAAAERPGTGAAAERPGTGAAAQSAEIRPVSETAQPGPADREVEAARRFAKLVATDIRLYNEEAVVQGRRDGDLARRLAEQLSRGRETFERRYGSMGPAGLSLLHEAYVEVLAGGDGELLSDIATPPATAKS